jgi:uncharacterized protein (DUF2062 family)
VKHRARKWLPKLTALKKNPSLKKVKGLLKCQGLEAYNRHTVAGGIAVGLFINFLPLPFQMFWAAFLAILFSVNLPIAVAVTWINNPLTFIPINFFIYKVGSILLMESPTTFSFPTFQIDQNTFDSFFQELIVWLGALGKPYLLGVAVVSLSAALSGYFLTHAFWSISLLFSKKTIEGKIHITR